MPIIGSFGAGSAGGYGQRKGVAGPIIASYLVLAGGGGGSGGGASFPGAGAGAGGYRTSYSACGSEKSGGPDNAPGTVENTFEISPGPYSIVVGGGGSPGPVDNRGTVGSPSSFNGICTTGGGSGGAYNGGPTGFPGGSGGGGAAEPGGAPGGSGIPNQGYPGGSPGSPPGGGGGGANSAGQGPPSAAGSGLTSTITGSPVTRASGGTGGSSGTPGPANSGKGGNGNTPGGTGGSGGSGIVVVRFPRAACVSVAPCTNTVTSCVGPTNDKVATFTVTGTLTVS